MNRAVFALFAVAVLALSAMAEDTPITKASEDPTSPKASEAKASYDFAIKKAEADFIKAQADAAKAYADRLQEAMKIVLKAEKPDLAEANRIDAKIKELAAAVPTTQAASADFKWLMGVKWKCFQDQKHTLTFYTKIIQLHVMSGREHGR